MSTVFFRSGRSYVKRSHYPRWTTALQKDFQSKLCSISFRITNVGGNGRFYMQDTVKSKKKSRIRGRGGREKSWGGFAGYEGGAATSYLACPFARSLKFSLFIEYFEIIWLWIVHRFHVWNISFFSRLKLSALLLLAKSVRVFFLGCSRMLNKEWPGESAYGTTF